MKLTEINWSELKVLRKKQWLKQNKKCAILQQEIEYKDAVMDHKHKKKSEPVGKDGKGLLRGVLHKYVNSFEGKVVYWYTRYGLHNLVPLPKLLRKLADFLENPPMKSVYIHPSERKKPKKLQKKCFNELNKVYKLKYPKRKPLEFPKRGYLTKKLNGLFNEFEIPVQYLHYMK